MNYSAIPEPILPNLGAATFDALVADLKLARGNIDTFTAEIKRQHQMVAEIQSELVKRMMELGLQVSA